MHHHLRPRLARRASTYEIYGLRIACALFFSACVASALESTPPVIAIDGQDTGRIYDGIGALSAGASSRLLIDYPDPQRGEILDYLFKPGFGAALQINKVEIGGDMNSTDGAEPSHMRTPTEENYRRGYEWWLMVESKKRNPVVKLYGLQWGAPGWINPARNNIHTKENIDYLIKWVQHAKSDYGLEIDYLGDWNERPWSASWHILFRKALNDAGLSKIKVLLDDALKWKAGLELKKDPAFADSIDIIGEHYPERIGDRLSSSKAGPPDEVKEAWQACFDTGKPLWASEHGSSHFHRGAKDLARHYNRGYIRNKTTAYINWSTVWAVLAGQPYSGCGLMLADEPWSGHYEVGLSIWATAHTTQFTQPGWKYLDGACSLFSEGEKAVGSCVALRSPDSRDFSVIVETLDAKKPLAATFEIKPGLPTGALHLWKTRINSKLDADWFVQQRDIAPVGGRFTLDLEPGCVYTVSTISSAHKGTTTPPAKAMLPLPYKEDFQSYEIGRTPKYLSDQGGAFEIAPAGGGRSGKCLRQVVTTKPIFWNGRGDPCTLVGHPDWKNYTVSVDALLEQPGYVELAGQVPVSKTQSLSPGYYLRLDDLGHWSLRMVYDPGVRRDLKEKEIASGELPNIAGTGKWNKLSMSFKGGRISASINDQVVVPEMEEGTFSGGLVALVTKGWIASQFMNLEVIK